MKAKKGQILVLVLILMAVGLIVISPLLSYLNTSYAIYQSKFSDTMAYYTVDAMIQKIFSDMYAGQDIYDNYKHHPEYYNNQSWLNGYQINTSINNSMVSPPERSGSSEELTWNYMDPGCDFGLNTLAHNDDPAYAHSFRVALTEGTTVTAHWYFKDSPRTHNPPWNYYCSGKMWIAYDNGSAIPGATTGVVTFTNTAFNQSLSWTVPPGWSDDYFIKFQNLATRQTGSSTTEDRSFSDHTSPDWSVRPTYSSLGDPTYTWVCLGNSSGGQIHQYQDYTITTTASLSNTTIVTVTACVRESPGPSWWWEHHSLAVVSWIVTYPK